MNCFSASLASMCCVAALIIPFEQADAKSDPLVYKATYTLRPDPAAGEVEVELSVEQPRFLLRELRMAVNAERIDSVTGDGVVSLNDGAVRWTPEETGGTLKWTVQIANRRNGDGYDAWLDADWGLFRAEDVIPRATTRTLRGAASQTRMRIELPRKWSAVSEYFERDGTFDVARADRRFDEPSGWIVIGELGVRRDTIAGTRVAVAAPTGQTTRRLEALALLRWTLPELSRVVPELPDRLTIVSAGEPMWRGALSAPASLFIHADRPLISENATSTLLHEIMHVVTRLTSRQGFDWIVEGIAEYYSLELLNRSGTISRRRYDAARAIQAEWSKEATSLCGEHSTGPTTALAVTLFVELDKEIRERSKDAASFDDVLVRLVDNDDPVDLESLRNVANEVSGGRIETLHTDKLPGCSNITRE